MREKTQTATSAVRTTYFVTLGEQDALDEGDYAVLVGVPDPLAARRQRRSH